MKKIILLLGTILLTLNSFSQITDTAQYMKDHPVWFVAIEEYWENPDLIVINESDEPALQIQKQACKEFFMIYNKYKSDEGQLISLFQSLGYHFKERKFENNFSTDPIDWYSAMVQIKFVHPNLFTRSR